MRLSQGKRESAKVYSEKPLKIAQRFIDEGAERLHIVDLDAAFRSGNNLGAIESLAKLDGARIQVGGGIRTIDYGRKLLKMGVGRVIIGSSALNEEKLWDFALEFGEKVWVAVDVKDGKVYSKGWKEKNEANILDFLSDLEGIGIGGVILTDISGDGMLNGASIDFFKEARSVTCMRIIASGGITYGRDILALKKLGFEGAIVGKAVYENRIDISELVRLIKKC